MEVQATNGLYKLCEWFYRLAYLNLLAIAGTICGGVILGLFPSIIAMFAINNRWQEGENDFSISRHFWKTYKSHFLKANKFAGVMIFAMIALYIDFTILPNFHGLIYYLILSSSTTVLIIICSVLLYIFYLMATSDLGMLKQIKTALHITTLLPLQTVWLFISTLSFLFICWVIPGLAIFYLGSGAVYITTYFSRFAMRRLSKTHNIKKHVERGALDG
ncbi:Uncharacterized membrane protein YesL [Gracilibacillus ureilyticus]|uniref:Uncharacterized membrane protein YesL n=1 Tax=Gracilibacillus ureilyticus TaxID=531814 RepID=A0A1H9PP01_9BACI|nr:DUF624 domain-containing protein [Gracilibacillus ureilyticus]SER49293.1 Uncharacterized membrane protein YesL [Gracilibacillus ureilyticus]